MNSTKLVIFFGVMVIFLAITSAGLLDSLKVPNIMLEKYQLMPTKDGYRLNLDAPEGSKREEVAMVVNPDTPEEQLVIKGMHSVYDEKTDTDTITMYTADKDGFKPRYMLKNRKLSANTLKSTAG
ncbi:uncharacterized protein ACRADG_005857 [Cochliomyia hominivorax]